MVWLADTQVVLYALGGGSKVDANMRASARLLIANAPEIHVSSVTMLEMLRGARDERTRTAIGALPLVVRAFDVRMAAVAAELVAKHNASEKTCDVCGVALNANECRKCKRLISGQQRLADAMIAATAQELPDVDVLYTFDAGLLSYAKLVRNCTVRAPDHANGPLFAKT